MNGRDLTYYLSDPFLNRVFRLIKSAGPIRSVSLDITHECNLRCTGCYYFGDGMDRHMASQESLLDDWIHRELQRGTNFVTVVGGEPSLVLSRLKKIYDHFKVNVATNGLKKIPLDGFERLPIGVAIWGNTATDSRLRANGKRNLFGEALRNYKNDQRAFWYYTVAPGLAHEIEEVVDRCIQNGNRVLFNYYSDLSGLGGEFDYRQGFEAVMDAIDRMMEKYPGKILSTPYLNQVVATGKLEGMTWGYDVCTNLSENFAGNQSRLSSGTPSNRHFRAYNSDFTSTRRCCTGTARSCDSCFDTWEHFSWIMLHYRKHLHSKEAFTNWLGTMYLFYALNHLLTGELDEQKLILFQNLSFGRAQDRSKESRWAMTDGVAANRL